MNKRQYKSVIVLDENMNVTQDYVLKDDEEVKIEIKKKTLTPKQKHFLNKQSDFKNHCDNLGGYINMIYCKNEILFNNVNIDKANISRITYLATYIDYNDRREGLLCTRGKDNKLNTMNRKTMQNILGLSDSTFKRFLKDMKDNNLIYETDKKFYVNPTYFNKGNMGKLDTNKSYCRLFINPVRSLYNGCKTTKHKSLATIYQLIPYVHYATNIICHNPNELETNATPMSLKDIGVALNIDNNKGNLNKLVKELREFKIDANGKSTKIFNHVRLDSIDYYIVNPYIIYSGNNVEQLRKISDTYFFF